MTRLTSEMASRIGETSSAATVGFEASGGYSREHFTPNNSSELYIELCGIRTYSDSNSDSNSTRRCGFPPVVELNRTLTCIGTVECSSDTLRVIKTIDPNASDLEWAQTCSAFQYRWTTTSCSLQVQVDSLGKIHLVDPLVQYYNSLLNANSGNTFKVDWSNPTGNNSDIENIYPFPVYENGTCNVIGCEVLSTSAGTCLCDSWINGTAAYTNASNPLPTPTEIKSVLFIGAL